MDDATWTEVRNFQKCLLQMAMAAGKDVVFMETAMRLNGGRAHAVRRAAHRAYLDGAWAQYSVSPDSHVRQGTCKPYKWTSNSPNWTYKTPNST